MHSTIWINPQEAGHQGTIEMLWRHFLGALMSSIFIYSLRKKCDVYLCFGTKKKIGYASFQKGSEHLCHLLPLNALSLLGNNQCAIVSPVLKVLHCRYIKCYRKRPICDEFNLMYCIYANFQTVSYWEARKDILSWFQYPPPRNFHRWSPSWIIRVTTDSLYAQGVSLCLIMH